VSTGTPANEKLSVLKPGRGRAEAFADCRDCPEMVVVPAGQAVLGGHEQGAWNFRGEPGSARTVVLKTPFAVSRYPISIERWRACVEAGACRPAPFLIAIRPALPATRVSWFDAQGYVQWLSQVTGRRYRLLSEAEWEYLRLGQAGERPGLLGETPFQRYSPLFGLGLKRITDTPANAWGIHPMPEGVLEWVEDCWHPSLNQAPTDGSAWLSSGRGDCSYRVVRGAGSIGLGGFRRQQLARAMEFADVRTIEIGFRVARDIAGPTVTALEAK
jgi:formylglycine-generating enzyme required for sulfatase activity